MFERRTPPLFENLPGHLRLRDARDAEQALEALMALLTEELQVVERDIDQLYDNFFVETCEPWALSYLAELLGATPMREIDPARPGQLRAYVANVLSYRAAKGTTAALEQVAGDVSGWPVVAVEFFTRLGTTTHVNNAADARPVFASVRDSGAAGASRSPFSPALHAAGAGQADSPAGRYNIPHLGLFVWRQRPVPFDPVIDEQAGYLGGPMPSADPVAAGLHRFDPLGRDLPLVNRPLPDTEVATRMNARRVPGPLDRHLLHGALEVLRAGGPDPEGWFSGSQPVVRLRLDGAEVPQQRLHCCHLGIRPDGTVRRPSVAGEILFDPELGRLSLHPDDAARPVEAGFVQAAAFDIGGGPYDRQASVATWSERFWIEGEAPPWRIGVTRRADRVTDDPLQGGPVVRTLAEALARWRAEAGPGSRGVITLMDNATYPEPLDADAGIAIPPDARLAIVAGDWPFREDPGGVVRRPLDALVPTSRRPVLRTDILDVTGGGADTGDGAELVLDGIVLQGVLRLAPDGDLHRLEIRHCTVGVAPDGRLQLDADCAGNTRLTTVIAQAMIAGFTAPDAAGTVTISESILGEAGGAGSGLVAPLSDIEISATTLFGPLTARSLRGENCLFLGPLDIARKQEGCIRYSFLPGTASVPRRYACVPGPETPDRPGLRPVFTSDRYDRPGFGQLSRRTPEEIATGAEQGREMGVGYGLRQPARLANLAEAIAEFSPFGLSTGLFFMT